MATLFTTQSHPLIDVKLDGTNYFKWSITTVMLFDSLDLFSHIDDITPLSSDSDAKPLADWDADYRFVHGIIFQSVAIDICGEIYGVQATGRYGIIFVVATSSPIFLVLCRFLGIVCHVSKGMDNS